MALNDVLNALVLNGYTEAEERTIRDVFTRIYNDSPSARTALESWITGASLVGHDGVRLPENAVRVAGGAPTDFRQLPEGEDRPIIFTQADGTASARWFTGQINYGFDYIDGLSYIDNFGNAVASSHLTVIVHELGHAIAGFRDVIAFDEETNSVTGDVAGDTVRFQNVIHEELGIAPRNSYIGQSRELSEGFAYTNGQEIDRAIADRNGVDVNQNGTERDLLILVSDRGGELNGGWGDDWLYGRDGNDRMNGGWGDDWLYGRGGNDRLLGLEGDDYLFGAAGNDNMFGGDGADTLNGGDGNDTLQGGGQDDLVEGNAGNDQLMGFWGNDTMLGGAGNDTLKGEFNADSLDGGAGNDWIFGGAGDDTIDGGAGSDWMIFGDANSWSDRGSGGRDIFVFNRGNGVDQIHDFEDGLDLIRLGDGLSFADVQVSKNGNATQIIFTSGAAMGDRIKLIGIEPDQITIADFEGETAAPTSLQPTFTGSAGADVFSDRSGADDVIFASGGTDTIYAGLGDDIIDAGSGTDWNVYGDWTNWSTRGAGGQDKFWLKTGNGIDQIRDFEDGIDKILLEEGKTFDDVMITQWSIFTEIRYQGGLSGDRMMLVGIDRENITAQDFVTLEDIGQTPSQPTTPTPSYQLRYGTNESDEIITGAGSEKILARGGSDNIYAGLGDDFINAGAGNDWSVYGDASSFDTPGSGGADIFFFAQGNQIDQIRDFEDGIDKIQLANGRGFDDIELSGWDNHTLMRFMGGDYSDMLILRNIENWQISADDFV